MRRFFVTAWPRFGRGPQLNVSAIEDSPFFWWWYALTLNEEYRAYCASAVDGGLGEAQDVSKSTLAQLFADFGDVRYEGCRYQAFKQWWSQDLGEGETRGSWLFAEPTKPLNVKELKSSHEAAEVLERVDAMLVSIPLNFQRGQIDRALDRLLKSRLKVSKGRSHRDPRKSQARYHLTKPAQAKALRHAFALYDARAEDSVGARRSNAELAKAVHLPYQERPNKDEVWEKGERQRVMSMLVSRHIASAKKMIANVGVGQFP